MRTRLQVVQFALCCIRQLSALLILLLFLSGCEQRSGGGGATAPGAADKPSYAFVTNGVAGFWTIAKAGADQAAKELGVEVTTIMPANTVDQTRKVEDLLTRGVDGIAISPINPDNQEEAINLAATKTNLITHDSDAPNTNRLVYIGMDNYDAGLVCGKLAREALPQGGEVMLFIGRVDQDNAKRRQQGFIDGFLGREPDNQRRDPMGEVLKSEDGKYVVLGTMIDNFDRAKAKANAEDVLTSHPTVKAMVGLFEYNPPAIMEALGDRIGQVKVVGFDENEVMLQGIKDGTVVGAVAQNPFMYGYESVRVLHELHQGNQSVIPENKFIDIPARVILQDDQRQELGGAEVVPVDTFWEDLKTKLGKD